MRKAVIYARVSSKEQEREGFSIPAQLKLLKDYASSKSFHVNSTAVNLGVPKGTTVELASALINPNPATIATYELLRAA